MSIGKVIEELAEMFNAEKDGVGDNFKRVIERFANANTVALDTQHFQRETIKVLEDVCNPEELEDASRMMSILFNDAKINKTPLQLPDGCYPAYWSGNKLTVLIPADASVLDVETVADTHGFTHVLIVNVQDGWAILEYINQNTNSI